MTHIAIRRAAAADTDAISSVVKESWLASNRHFLPEDSQRAVSHGDRLAEIVTMHWQAIQVAIVNGKIVGAVGANDMGHMWMLYVLPDYQGLGIGSALYNAAIDSIKQTGQRKAMLEVLAANESAVAFYRTRGWVPEGRRTEHIPGFRFTAVRMGLALA